MTFLTIAMLAAVISRLPEIFDSHQVIQGLMTEYPQDYVRELNDVVHDLDPITAAHKKIGMAIYDAPGVVADGDCESANVRGKTTKNKRWRKV